MVTIEIEPSTPTEEVIGLLNLKDKVAAQVLAAIVMNVPDAVPLPLLAVLVTAVAA